MRSWWRSCTFVLILLTASILGFAAHRAAEPEDRLAFRGPPVSIDVYTEDPDQKINLTATVNHIIEEAHNGQPAKDRFVIMVEVNGDASGLLLVSSTQDSEGDGILYRPVTYFGRPAFAYYVGHAGDGNRRVADGHSLSVGWFDMPEEDVTSTADGLTANMPALAPAESGNLSYPLFGISDALDNDAKLVQVDGATLPQDAFGSRDPTKFGFKKGAALFWEPNHLTTEERLSNVGYEMGDATVDVNLPATGTLQGNDFVWSGQLGLSPELSTTKRSAATRRSLYEFYSGIALASGAAALLALIQEGKDSIAETGAARWVSRRRHPGQHPEHLRPGAALDASDTYEI